MAEDPNEDSWLYGGHSNADEATQEEAAGESNEEGLRSGEASTAEDKLADNAEAPTEAGGNNEEDDGFKEDEDFQKNAEPTDDDPFEDDAVSVFVYLYI